MLTAIGDVMRRCYEKGWITTRDGNISLCKHNGRYLYITPAGMRKTIVHPEWMVKIGILDDPDTGDRRLVVDERQKPSGELQMHWNLQQRTPRMRVVVHVHATHVVAAMYRGFDLQRIAQDFVE